MFHFYFQKAIVYFFKVLMTMLHIEVVNKEFTMSFLKLKL